MSRVTITEVNQWIREVHKDLRKQATVNENVGDAKVTDLTVKYFEKLIKFLTGTQL